MHTHAHTYIYAYKITHKQRQFQEASLWLVRTWFNNLIASVNQWTNSNAYVDTAIIAQHLLNYSKEMNI